VRATPLYCCVRHRDLGVMRTTGADPSHLRIHMRPESEERRPQLGDGSGGRGASANGRRGQGAHSATHGSERLRARVGGKGAGNRGASRGREEVMHKADHDGAAAPVRFRVARCQQAHRWRQRQRQLPASVSSGDAGGTQRAVTQRRPRAASEQRQSPFCQARGAAAPAERTQHARGRSHAPATTRPRVCQPSASRPAPSLPAFPPPAAHTARDEARHQRRWCCISWLATCLRPRRASFRLSPSARIGVVLGIHDRPPVSLRHCCLGCHTLDRALHVISPPSSLPPALAASCSRRRSRSARRRLAATSIVGGGAAVRSSRGGLVSPNSFSLSVSFSVSLAHRLPLSLSLPASRSFFLSLPGVAPTPASMRPASATSS